MTLSKDNKKPEQTKTQRIVMWCVFGIAAVLLIIAIVLFISNGVRFF